jgi:beta-phosphoglucomutase-like phosphatase (HAD superfamily)
MVGLKALIWDLDGTLAETEELHRQAFNLAFAEAGLPFSWDRELYRALLKVTGGRERIAHYLETCPDCPALSPEAIAQLHRRKNALYQALLEEGVELRPGVRRLLLEAKEAGLRQVLATTTSPENAQALLRRAGLEGVFDLVLAGDAVPRKKPDPSIYLLALEALGLAPEEALAPGGLGKRPPGGPGRWGPGFGHPRLLHRPRGFFPGQGHPHPPGGPGEPRAGVEGAQGGGGGGGRPGLFGGGAKMVEHLIVFNAEATREEVLRMAEEAREVLLRIPGVVGLRFGEALFPGPATATSSPSSSPAPRWWKPTGTIPFT